MKKMHKGNLRYGVVLLVCIASISIIGWTAHKKADDYEITYQKLKEESQAALKTLEEEKAKLEKENKELQAEVTQVMSEKSDLITKGQALADLTDIYKIYKSGRKKDAADKFKKIEPMGFDDATLTFYEILKNNLEK